MVAGPSSSLETLELLLGAGDPCDSKSYSGSVHYHHDGEHGSVQSRHRTGKVAEIPTSWRQQEDDCL